MVIGCSSMSFVIGIGCSSRRFHHSSIADIVSRLFETLTLRRFLPAASVCRQACLRGAVAQIKGDCRVTSIRRGGRTLRHQPLSPSSLSRNPPLPSPHAHPTDIRPPSPALPLPALKETSPALSAQAVVRGSEGQGAGTCRDQAHALPGLECHGWRLISPVLCARAGQRRGAGLRGEHTSEPSQAAAT